MNDSISYNDFTQEQASFKTAKGGMLAVDTKKGIVEAFAAAIGNKDSVNDIIVPGAFEESLRRRKPRVVWGHDWNKPIGKVLEIYEVGPNDPRLPMKMRSNGVGGLFVKVQFNLNSERGRQAFADVEFFGEEQEWSIGYKTLVSKFDPVQKANVLQKLELYEVSPVLHGANNLTATLSIKDAQNAEDGYVDLFEFHQEEKAGRTIATRNMRKLRQALTLLQEVVDDGTIPEPLERKYSEKVAQFPDSESIVFGDTKSVSGVKVAVNISSADELDELMQAAEDLVCCKGYLAEFKRYEPEVQSQVIFYLPGGVDAKDALAKLNEMLESVNFELSAKLSTVGDYEPTASIPVEELFTEPDSVG